jgi:hypothetical protein
MFTTSGGLWYNLYTTVHASTLNKTYLLIYLFIYTP